MARTYIHRSFNDYCALVPAEDWEALFAGDAKAAEAAKERMAVFLNGVDLYYHAGPILPGEPDDYISVTIADLLSHGIIQRVTLHKDE